MIQAKGNLTSLRVKAGYSMRALASAAGVAYRSVFHAEHGGAVTPKNARKLCEVLELDFDDLFLIVEEDEHGKNLP